MNMLWDYLWPVFAAGAAAGAMAGTLGFRGSGKKLTALIAGAAAAIALAVLWHGPLGAADRFSIKVERNLQATLRYYEMTQVTAHLQTRPITRRVLLSGRADDFQRTELVRVIDQLPGVSSSTWSPRGRSIPLIGEAAATALLGFLLGVLLAYLVELRRRHNAQWNW